MEVTNKHEKMLSNQEVLDLLKEMKENKNFKGLKNLATIGYETIKYLEETPAKHQDEKSITNFLQKIKEKEFRLTKAEKLQIVNHRPTNLVELQLLMSLAMS